MQVEDVLRLEFALNQMRRRFVNSQGVLEFSVLHEFSKTVECLNKAGYSVEDTDDNYLKVRYNKNARAAHGQV